MVRCAAIVPAIAAVLAAAAPLREPPRYTAAMLDGASFDERVRVTVRTQSGGATRLETVGREARWQLRAAAADSAVAVEAWYDSLLIWRDGPEGRLLPDTDGLIGGRFRGRIAAAGLTVVTTRPFIPDEVAEVSDLAEAFTRLLPMLPGSALAPGAVWDDGRGLRIVRRPDSTGAGAPLARYRWTSVAADTVTEVESDSLRYQIHSTVKEEGALVWHPRFGPLVWHREVVTDLEIPAAGPVRRPVRSRVEERFQAWRRGAAR